MGLHQVSEIVSVSIYFLPTPTMDCQYVGVGCLSISKWLEHVDIQRVYD